MIFFLYKLKDIGLYVSLFAIGHSVTMLYGVYAGVNVNPYVIDAIIGLSVVYKALDNLGAYQRWFGVQPNTCAWVIARSAAPSAWPALLRSMRRGTGRRRTAARPPEIGPAHPARH